MALPDVLKLSFLLLLLESPDHAQSTGQASTSLTRVMTDYWAWRMREFPQSATWRGIHDHDDKLDRYTLEAFKEQRDSVAGFLGDLADIDESSLSHAELTNLQILREEMQQFVNGYKFVRYAPLNPLNFLEGVHRDLYWVNTAKYETLEDFLKYGKRLEAFPKQLDDVIGLLQEAIRLRRTNHAASMTGVPKQLGDIIKPSNESFFSWPYREKLNTSSVPENQRENISARGMELIANQVNPALTKLKHFVETEYMNNTRKEYGVGSFEFGQDYYQACLKFHMGNDMTAQEVYDLGMQEVERISAQMRQIMRENNFHKSIAEFVSYLEKNRTNEFYNRTAEQLLEGYRHIIFQLIAPKLDSIVTVKEDVPIKVAASDYDGPAGSYGSNTFWVNTFNPETKTTYTMMALTLHEASPGHHLQISVSRQQPTPDFRRLAAGERYYAPPFNFLFYSAYQEGWGLYSEYLGEEMGLYNQSAMEMFGRYSEEIFRACRLVVDTGIHSMGKSKEWAIEFLTNYTALPQPEILVEVNRYITWPGQACAYKIGELEIKRMRKKAEDALGDAFDVRYFHDVLLKIGTSPMTVVEQAVDEFIAANKPTKSPPTSDASRPGNSVMVAMVISLLWCYVLKL